MTIQLPTQIFELLGPTWENTPVRLVTFPAPPHVVAHDVLFPEDCWRSDVLERGEEIFNHHGVCLGSRLTDKGPAFLIEYRLGDLFSVSDRVSTMPKSIYCATISFAVLLESRGVRFPTDAVIESANHIMSSSNPGSHSSAPGMPWLSMLLAMDRGMAVRSKSSLMPGFKFTDDIESRSMFPGIRFDENENLDRVFRYFTTSMFGSSPHVVDMFTMRTFEKILELDHNEDLWCKSRGQVDRYIDSIDNRERRKSNGYI